jgi:hypothetical protein
MRIGWLLAALCGANLVPGAAGQPVSLWAEAAKGHTAQVKAFLDRGENIEATDKEGRTALMVAAQHGRLETMRMLMDRGARTDARDHEANTAYMLALFAPVGRGDRDGVLQALPKPPKPRVTIEANWSQGRLVSSCYLSRGQLAATVAEIQPDELLARELAAYIRVSGRGVVELTDSDPNFIVTIDVQPGAACAGQSDNLILNIDVRLLRGSDRKVLFQKNFGGGVKGFRMQPVDNPAQYAPVFEGWIKAQPEPIYSAVAAEACRYTPQQ